MSFQKFFFGAVDKLYDRPQNEGRNSEYRDVKFDIEMDIVYDDAAPQDCTLDICRVPQEGKYPVLFYIHGGGFEAGDKRYRRAIAQWSAANGYFVVNVNYGLCPKYKCPQPHRHLVSALNWVGENSEKYNIDLSRIMVAGDSAGAYYGACLACISLNKGLQEELGAFTDLRFGAAAFVSGIYDITSLLKRRLVFNLGKRLFKDIAGIEPKDIEGYEWKHLCNILDYIDKDFPPCFITHAKKDIFCRGQAEALEAALEKNGVYYEEYSAKKFADNHCFSINGNSKAARENNALLADFMARFRDGKIQRN